jgi:hypothetical protein
MPRRQPLTHAQQIKAAATLEAHRLCNEAEAAYRAWGKRFGGRQRNPRRSKCPTIAPDWAIAEREADYQGLRTLGARRPERWLAMIGQIPPHHRAHLASVVWWDWFAPRPANARWLHLDAMINSFFDDAPIENLSQYLIKLGYSPYRVAKRLQLKINANLWQKCVKCRPPGGKESFTGSNLM